MIGIDVVEYPAETSMSEKIIVKNCRLQVMFEDKICPFLMVNETTQTKVNFEQHVVICNDLNGLVDKIIKERNIDKTNMLIRIGLDGGRWVYENLPFNLRFE